MGRANFEQTQRRLMVPRYDKGSEVNAVPIPGIVTDFPPEEPH